MIAALAAMPFLSTNAIAQDSEDATPVVKPNRVSANGSYEFKPTWGIGLQYGLTFTELDNFNNYLLLPSKQNYYKVNYVAEHELYGEWSPVEGFRISIFGGWQSAYIKNTGYDYFYGGIEPAFAARRSFYEFAVGLGLAYGGSLYSSESDEMDNGLKGHGLMVRPFVEARFYPCDIFAIYLRLAFNYVRDFGVEATDTMKMLDTDKRIDEDQLALAGPNVSVGIRFGNFELPKVVVGDADNDGVLDDIDQCPENAGSEEFYGCPTPDSDGDGLCDSWVTENGLNAIYADICKGQDQCSDRPEDVDGFEDEDGCPDPDNDGDGMCDAWVAENGLADAYADVCKGADQCADEAEDVDGFKDEDGCADPDNDGDGLCDAWVAENGLSEKYAAICKERDYCPDEAGDKSNTYGCGPIDEDNDGFCNAWVYQNSLQENFPECKGLDMCPNEKGSDHKGCIPRRVEVTSEAIQINDAINFASNKAVIQKSSDSLLEEIANVFKENPQIKKVSIEGHTDLSGKAAKNQTLSENRAKAVMDRLIKLGVEPERMESKGFGMTRPVEPLAAGQKKETKEQAAKNRRVEFNIIEQETVKTTMTLREARQAGYTRDEVTLLDKQGNPVENKKADDKKADDKK